MAATYLDSSALVKLAIAVRSLDAIHLATAQQLGTDLSEIVTYDEGMIEAARQLGMKTANPV